MSRPESWQWTHLPHRLTIGRAGRPLLVQQASPAARPFIHPIHDPLTGVVLTEDEPSHHVWQHGLYTGLNDINGVGFWTEGRNPKNAAIDGRIASKELSPPVAADEAVSWAVMADWFAPDGQQLIAETQAWRLYCDGPTMRLQLAWTIAATTDLRMGRWDYGGLFLRMPWHPQSHAAALDSEGRNDRAAIEGSKARWVAISMVPMGATEPSTIAIFDHPANLHHPVPWRLDGQFGLSPSPCVVGESHLKQGQSRVNQYELVIQPGRPEASEFEARWQAFSRS